MGVSTLNWFVIAILSPILHQIYVLSCWRFELYFKSISNTFGKSGFTYFKIGFALLIALRPLTIIILSISNKMTLQVAPIVVYIISAILFVPGVYLFYSVKKYFGMEKAFGRDHFNPEIARTESFVKQGIFKYSSNAMYKFGFLILYIPGLLLQSKAAILVAFFNHIYIWIHYYFTELPDIKTIYDVKEK